MIEHFGVTRRNVTKQVEKMRRFNIIIVLVDKKGRGKGEQYIKIKEID